MARGRARVVRILLAALMSTGLVVITSVAALGPTAQAAASGVEPAAGMALGAASTAASTPCVVSINAPKCESADPDLTVDVVNTGDTSACTFIYSIAWGDGSVDPRVTFDGVPQSGTYFLAAHTYHAAQTKTYSITASPVSVIGNCTSESGSYTFTLDIGATAPAAPSGLTVKAVDPNAIRLNWHDNSGNESGFEINNGVTSKKVGANSTSYIWGGLAPSTYMCFKIRAYDSVGSSGWVPDVSPWYVCTTTPPLSIVQQQPPVYAGYSAHPSQGTVSFAQANWTVPAIASCKSSKRSSRYEADVSVWAGLWGGPNTGTGIDSAWLPQVGTISGCTRYLGIQTNNYAAVVQIYNAKHNAKGYKTLFKISDGDRMYSHIEYIGHGTGAHAGELRFWYYVGDLTASASASGYLYTTIGGVSLTNAVYQGGVIVEKVSGQNVSGDLPKFAEINISNVYVGQNPSNPKTTWTVYRWDLRQPGSHGKVYATTEPVNNFPVPNGHGSFGVKWVSY